MRAIRKKMQSQRGASITFALLLFLVCAVVGSAVLTAGTAASGRMSRLAENDQRYYSVNSAARLLIDTITKEEVKVRETKVFATDTSPDPVITYGYSLNGEEVMMSATYCPSLTLEAVYQKMEGDLRSGSIKRDVTFTPSNNDVLTVEAKETVNPDLSMRYQVYNRDGTERYTVNISFAAERVQTLPQKPDDYTEITTATYRWTLREIW